jgi:hypothetical protein
MKSVLLLLPIVVACAPAQREAALRSAEVPHPQALFEFHSDPWVNLHQRLIAEATSNKFWHSAVSTCACAIDSNGATSAPWSEAVSAYKTGIGQRSQVFDPTLAKMNLELAIATTELPRAGLDPLLSKPLESVWETYRHGAWAADDARNRAWIEATLPIVQKWGPDIANEYAKRFRTVWPSRPIRVEVSQYAGSVGAYTTSDPILVTMSSDDKGYVGAATLEMLFHEASHGLDGTLTHDLQMAFLAKGKHEPPKLDHAIIFYTAGELVRRRVGGDYVPYAYAQGVYARGWQAYEAALRVHWRAWLDDTIDYATALDRLATAL